TARCARPRASRGADSPPGRPRIEPVQESGVQYGSRPDGFDLVQDAKRDCGSERKRMERVDLTDERFRPRREPLDLVRITAQAPAVRVDDGALAHLSREVHGQRATLAIPGEGQRLPERQGGEPGAELVEVDKMAHDGYLPASTSMIRLPRRSARQRWPG